MRLIVGSLINEFHYPCYSAKTMAKDKKHQHPRPERQMPDDQTDRARRDDVHNAMRATLKQFDKTFKDLAAYDRDGKRPD
jgi:hypothetical protein